jgi:hypothetical protein
MIHRQSPHDEHLHNANADTNFCYTHLHHLILSQSVQVIIACNVSMARLSKSARGEGDGGRGIDDRKEVQRFDTDVMFAQNFCVLDWIRDPNRLKPFCRQSQVVLRDDRQSVSENR